MSVVAPKVFRSTDTGASSLTGQVGTLLTVLDEDLIIGRMFTGISGGSFVDNSTEARLEGGTTFKLFQGPTQSNDEAYFGMTQKFERLRFDFGTPGVENTTITLTWEFWNGSSWTSLTPTDGTTKFTANGAVSWTISSLTGWVANSVNSATRYWIRVRFTAGSWTTNPLVNYVTAGGWTRAFSGTNAASYRQGGGAGLFLDLNDNAVGAGGAREVRAVGYETMSAVATGTGPFPTAAQLSTGITIRKSATADGTTRPYILACDDRSFILFIGGDSSTIFWPYYFGDIYAAGGSGDAYRVLILGKVTENASALTGDNASRGSGLGSAVTGHYMPRTYAGTGTSIQVGKAGQALFTSSQSNMMAATVQYPNGPDGGIAASQITVHEAANNTLRGRMRGLWQFGHADTNVSDQDTYSGVGALAGKTFLIIKSAPNAVSNGANGVWVVETSDTWETN